jgi:hypothetical protein
MASARDDKRPPTEREVRAALVAFAELVKRLDENERLSGNLPLIMGRLGDLRRMLFEYEVRVTERLLPSEDPAERESRRIVREAREDEEDVKREWESDGPS